MPAVCLRASLRLPLFAIALSALAPLPAAAQSLSAKDILARVEQKVAGNAEFQALLADPDPARSLAAMQIMLESRDPTLTRIALDAGLYSPSPQVQRTAIEAFLRSGPVINIYIDGSSAIENERYRYWINAADGTVDDKGRGYLSVKVGDYDAKNACFKLGERRDCLLRITDDGLSHLLFGRWGALKLNDQAELVGMGEVPDVPQPLPVRIPVAP